MSRMPWFGVSVALLLGAGSGMAGNPAIITLSDAAGAIVPDAVIFLVGESPGAATRGTQVAVDQQDRRFVPQVTVIQVGTEVSFPNSDSVSHHVYSFARPNAFELPLYRSGSRPVVRFDHPGIVTLGCNIHDGMLGWILVVETPYFGFTNAEGSVVFPDLPTGRYVVRVWSPRLDPASPIDAGAFVSADIPASVALGVKKRLRAAPAAGNALAVGDY